MDMEPFEALSFIDYAHEKRSEDMLYQRWIVGGYHFEMSFPEFKERLMPKPEKPEQEILEDVKRILDGMGKGEQRGNI